MPIFVFCSTTLTPTEYLDYFEKNRSRFTKTIERNDVKATVACMPVEYYVARDFQNDTTLSLDTLFNRYCNALYIAFSITGEKYKAGSVLLGRNGIQGFSDNVLKNTFGHEQDVFLLHGNDTVKAASINYDRNWGVGNADSFIAGFPRKQLKSDIKKYRCLIREMTPEIGTLDIALKDLIINTKRLKG